jgi:hypothetical protein
MTSGAGGQVSIKGDGDSYTIIQRTGYKIFSGLSQGTVKVLDDPEIQRWVEPVTDTVSSNSISEEKGDEIPSPQMTKAKWTRGPLHMEPSPRMEKDIRWKLTPPQLEEIMKFLQINLHHSKAAMAALCQQLAEGKADKQQRPREVS